LRTSNIGVRREVPKLNWETAMEAIVWIGFTGLLWALSKISVTLNRRTN